MDIKKLLDLRKKVKSRKPKYVRQDINKKKRLDDKWRRPRGSQSKVRLRLRGKRPRPEVGYGSPSAVRGTSPEGKTILLVRNVSQLAGANPDKNAIIIAKVGMKKKLEIVKRCQEMKLDVLNIKNLADYISSVTKEIADRKIVAEDKKRKRVEKSKTGKVSDKKKEKKEDQPQISDEDKKEKEKAEKDKILITKR